jgi:hypothetical protein
LGNWGRIGVRLSNLLRLTLSTILTA